MEDLKKQIKELLTLNVSDKTEKKNDLTYLSWGWALGEVMKIDPQFSYTILENENGLPYFYDELTGYLVKTEMTILGMTRRMWLPVMDSNNKAMKSYEYEYPTKYGKKKVEQATMFDINKTIMRCLVKNVAVCCGIGLYIYNGEDLPEQLEEEKQAEIKEGKSKQVKSTSKSQKAEKEAKNNTTIAKEQESIEAIEHLKKMITEKVEFLGKNMDGVNQACIKKYGVEFTALPIEELQKLDNQMDRMIKATMEGK